MHVPHVSHSGQLGFIEQPIAIATAALPPPSAAPALAAPALAAPAPALAAPAPAIAVHDTSQGNLKIPPDRSISFEATITTREMETVVSSVEDIVTTDASQSPPLAVAATHTALYPCHTEENKSTSSAPPVSYPKLQVSADPNSSSSSTSHLSSVEMKIVRLFQEGFQQSSKTNISHHVKVIGALNHACYKEHLGIIVTYFNLSSVAIPTIASLGKSAVREKYLNEVVNAYDEFCKGKIVV